MMAFMNLSSSFGNSIIFATPTACDNSDRNIPLFCFGFTPFSKHKVRRLTITNVATPLRPTAPPAQPPPLDYKESEGKWSHVAWTSVRQERWEGELHVQGTIPLWLVPLIFTSYTDLVSYLFIYKFICFSYPSVLLNGNNVVLINYFIHS